MRLLVVIGLSFFRSLSQSMLINSQSFCVIGNKFSNLFNSFGVEDFAVISLKIFNTFKIFDFEVFGNVNYAKFSLVN